MPYHRITDDVCITFYWVIVKRNRIEIVIEAVFFILNSFLEMDFDSFHSAPAVPAIIVELRKSANMMNSKILLNSKTLN